MSICAIIGHRKMYYSEYKERTRTLIIDLIENHGVTEFWFGGHNNFDSICHDIVKELKGQYPFLKATLILSYIPDKDNEEYDDLFRLYDGTLYLLERRTPPRYAILETAKKMVECADCVLSGVKFDLGGGAWKACVHAMHKKKPIINLFPEVDYTR